MRAVYFVLNGQVTQAPWNPGNNNQAGALTGFDTYIIKGVSPNEITYTYRENLWMQGSVTQPQVLINQDYRGVPVNNLFHGPFWIDPVLFRNVQVGDTITLGLPPNTEPWAVSFVGPVDLSPFNTEFQNLAGLSLQLPVPQDTRREVVTLYTEREGQRYTMVVDRRMGLIYYISMSHLSGGTWDGSKLSPLNSQLAIKVLA